MQMGLGGLTVGRKLVLPYLALTVLVGGLASAVAGVETAAVGSDQVNAAAGHEEDALTALTTDIEQNQLLELRLLSAAAVDPTRLRDELTPFLAAAGDPRLSVVDRTGIEILRMEISGSGCVCTTPDQPLQWPHIAQVVAGSADELGDKWSGLVEADGSWRLYAEGPIFGSGGAPAGGLILSQPLDAFLADASASLGFELALYSPAGELMAGTAAYPLAAPALTAELRERALSGAGLHVELPGNGAERLYFVPLRVRTDVVGYAALLVDTSALARADGTLQTLLVGTAGGMLLLILLAGWHITRSVTVPLELLLEAATEVAAEAAGVAARGEPGPSDEIARLKETFGSIANSLKASTEATVLALAAAIEARDPYTHGHSVRVAAYSLILARAAGLETPELEIVRRGCLVHDIGKIGVADGVLGKPGRLNEDELLAMRRHPAVGCQVLRALDWEPRVFEIVAQHHERWDGGGYPAGLAGEEIAPLARLVALADALDAMTSTRPYRTALSFAEAARRVVEGSGTQFEPGAVRLFKSVQAELRFCRASFENLTEPHHMLLEAIA